MDLIVSNPNGAYLPKCLMNYNRYSNLGSQQAFLTRPVSCHRVHNTTRAAVQRPASDAQIDLHINRFDNLR